MAVDTHSVWLTTVVPIVGCVAAWVMYSSPWPAIIQMQKTGRIGETNPLPYAFAFANGAAWVGYGFVIVDKWVVLSNLMGVMTGVYFTLVAYGCASAGVRRQLEAVIMLVVVALLVCGSVTVLHQLSRSAGILLWGIICTTILAFYWTAPLSTLYQVLRTRSSASLFWPLSAANLICSSLWTIYGFVLSQPFLWAPNGAGVLLSLFQLALAFIFPSTPPLLLEPTGGPHSPREVRVKVTLDLHGTHRDGRPSNMRQQSGGCWTDVSEPPETVAPEDPVREGRRKRMAAFASSSSLQLLLGSVRRGRSSDPPDEEANKPRA